MLSIILNHLQWYPNGLDWVAVRGSLFVSAAEGFFLLSGLVLGMVRGRKLLEKPFKYAATLLLKRAVVLYIASAVLTFLFLLIGWHFFMDNPGLKPGIRPIDQPLGEVIWGVLSFQYLYGWADFLRLYCLFLFASPLVLWLIRQGKWYIALAGSIGLWALFPLINARMPQSAELLMGLSWQLIFFGGFIIGFYWQPLTECWHRLHRQTRKRTLGVVLGLAVLTLGANIVLATGSALNLLPDPILSWYNSLQPYFYKEQLPWPRLLLFSLWFCLGFYLFHAFEKQIIKYAGWLLLPLGQNSLYVYILHAIVLFFVHTLIMAPDPSTPLLVNLIASLTVVGVIYLAVRKKFLFQIIPR